VSPISECDRCRALLDAASAAMMRFIEATGNLDLALLRNDIIQIPELEAAVLEANLTRKSAIAVYREHRVSFHS
jgi:hypothetical protein